MKINPEIFRAYDIRGEAGKDITPQVANAVGRAFGTYIRRKNDGMGPSFAKASEGKSGKIVREVRLDLIENPRVGDWLLCHADLAVNKVEEEEALKILEIVGECGHEH